MFFQIRILVGFAAVLAAGLGLAASADRNLSVSGSGSENVQRVALVIGNSTYPGVAALRNAANDATDIADKLKKLNFQVTLRTNLQLREMLRTLTDFGDRVQQGSEVLFFYAGHGMQVRGRNYLIPIDAEIRTESAVSSEAVDVDQLLDKLSAARLSMVILDACRNNPFERRFRGGGQGLASINAPTGTLIAYATAPGKVASDGDGRNGLYTQELLEAMDVPGIKVEDVFKRVRANVVRKSGEAQTPWESSSLTGDFYFFGQPTDASGANSTDAAEVSYWESIRNSTNKNEFLAYLKRYPDGKFADLARGKLFTVIEAEFGDVGGLKKGAPVTSAGVQIGHVDQVKGDPSGRSIGVRLNIDLGYRFPKDTLAKVQTYNDLTYIALVPGQSEVNLASGDRLNATEDPFAPSHPSYKAVQDTLSHWSRVATANRLPLELPLINVLLDQSARTSLEDAIKNLRAEERSTRAWLNSSAVIRALEIRRQNGSEPNSMLTARFSNVGHLRHGAPVIDLQSGAMIGRVSTVKFDNDSYEAVVDLYVSLDRSTLRTDTAALILTSPNDKRLFIGLRNGTASARLKSGDSIKMTTAAADDLSQQIEGWIETRRNGLGRTRP